MKLMLIALFFAMGFYFGLRMEGDNGFESLSQGFQEVVDDVLQPQ
jgi:hypothetical protein